MLIEFSVENYRSIGARQTLSMVASADKTLLDNNSFPISHTSKPRLLTSAVIYGPNASGKSNLVRAMRVVRNLVVESATRMQVGDRFDIQPFRLDANFHKQPSHFEIHFIQNGIRYEYGLILTQTRVLQEWLFAYPKGRAQNWFVRNYNLAAQADSWIFSSQLKGQKERIKTFVRPNSLFLSHAAQNNHPQLSEVFEWFRDKLNIFDNFSSMEGLTTDFCKEDEQFQQDVISFLSVADVGISGLKIESESLDDRKLPTEAYSEKLKTMIQLEYEVIRVKTLHKMKDSEDLIPFDLGEESDGTQRLFEIAGFWLITLEYGEILVMDELDRSLHPTLTTHLIKLFNDRTINKNNAQLIFTTHDTVFLDKNIFRRDQVWFTEKDKSSATKLYSLQDFKPIKDESLQKGYLQGRYGAIPFIGKLNI